MTTFFLPWFRLSAAYHNAYQEQQKRRLKRDSGEVEDDVETGNSTDINSAEKFKNGTWEIYSGNDTTQEGHEVGNGDAPDLEEESGGEGDVETDDESPESQLQSEKYERLSQSEEDDDVTSEERQVCLYSHAGCPSREWFRSRAQYHFSAHS